MTGRPVPEHGQTGYTYYGCRCDICRKANAARSLRGTMDRMRRAAAGEVEVPHGRSGYINYRCRCEVCTRENTRACVAYRKARRKREAAAAAS